MKKPIDVTCSVCGEVRTVKVDNANRPPCCQKCASKLKWKNETYRKSCSDSHIGYVMPILQREKITKANTGKVRTNVISGSDHYNWQGGITPESKRQRNSLNYKLWRKSCFERDCFTCQISGHKGGDLAVHHINNFSEFPELRYAIDNGITMSKQIHCAFHKLYGMIGSTKEQLQEFIENYQTNTMGSRAMGTK